MTKCFLVVNVDWFFLSHRLPIALAAMDQGYEVTIVTRDTGKSELIKAYGLRFIDAPFNRSSTNLLTEARTLRFLYNLYRDEKPEIIHHVTLKISLYGSIAVNFTRQYHVSRVINAISGLGYNFTEDRKGFTQRILLQLMKLGFRGSKANFIFQNEDDAGVFKKMRLVNDAQIHLIKGSGVDLDEFTFTPLPPKDRVAICFSARLLYDKGIVEFINAAKLLEKKFKDTCEFIIAGDIDADNPASLDIDTVNKLVDGSFITWLGYQDDMKSLLQNIHIAVLPSYREGLPKSLIEAAAIGRPIITTDVPGCRECVIDEYNGFLVTVKDSVALAKALEILIENPDLRRKMGANSRSLAEKNFDLQLVVHKTLELYHYVD